ncbi:MAG TPA: twin-arginine translocase subunit TatC, partial [Chloroflexi bacterium]|nr:twin-arginine translocase subunit TatC [Chloroflexota bacterium]
MSEAEPRSSIFSHLTELRKRLFRSAIAVGITTVLAFVFYDRIFNVLLYPAGETGLVFIDMTEMFGTILLVSLVSGIVLAIPYLTYEFIMFVSPALTPKEKRHFYFVLPWMVIMFAGGVVFAYFMLIPAAITFLLGFGGDIAVPQIRVSNYISVVARMLLVSGFVFEMPVVTTFLARIGVVSADWLAGKRKVVIIGAFILAAILTPPDAFTQIV